MNDYELVLIEKGVTQEWVDKITLDERDQKPFDRDYSVLLSSSDIHGQGLFAMSQFVEGAFVCPARLDGFRTPAGRYINHAKDPNCKMVEIEDNNIVVIALQSIELGSELTVDYRQSSKVAEDSVNIDQYNKIYKPFNPRS